MSKEGWHQERLPKASFCLPRPDHLNLTLITVLTSPSGSRCLAVSVFLKPHQAVSYPCHCLFTPGGHKYNETLVCYGTELTQWAFSVPAAAREPSYGWQRWHCSVTNFPICKKNTILLTLLRTLIIIVFWRWRRLQRHSVVVDVWSSIVAPHVVMVIFYLIPSENLTGAAAAPSPCCPSN